jgi:hypothetical protein
LHRPSTEYTIKSMTDNGRFRDVDLGKVSPLYELDEMAQTVTRETRDMETRRPRDHETTRLRDHETERLRDWETGRLGDWETTRLRDYETTRYGGDCGDCEIWRGLWRLRDVEGTEETAKYGGDWGD